MDAGSGPAACTRVDVGSGVFAGSGNGVLVGDGVSVGVTSFTTTTGVVVS